MPIYVSGAGEHNLQAIDIEFGDGLTIVIGVPGSGKTSLVFEMKSSRRFITHILECAAGGLTAGTYLRYRREIRAARERALTAGEVIETDCGPIEYAAGGDGPPVLVIHGAGGGCDQGLVLARLSHNDFHWIAMSRFGYLRTPFPVDASPEAQADAHAALLDALDIPRAAVMGISAGGPSALQFALRYPDRCTALVMVSAVCRAALPRFPLMGVVYQALFGWDFGFWLLSTIARPALLLALGAMPAVQARLTPFEKAWLSDFLGTVIPISLRRDGLRHDMMLCPTLPPYPLARIHVPTLVIHAVDDTLVPFSHSEVMARTIPDAQLIALPEGGHVLLGWQEEVGARVATFLKQYAWPGGLKYRTTHITQTGGVPSITSTSR